MLVLNLTGLACAETGAITGTISKNLFVSKDYNFSIQKPDFCIFRFPSDTTSIVEIFAEKLPDESLSHPFSFVIGVRYAGITGLSALLDRVDTMYKRSLRDLEILPRENVCINNLKGVVIQYLFSKEIEKNKSVRFWMKQISLPYQDMLYVFTSGGKVANRSKVNALAHQIKSSFKILDTKENIKLSKYYYLKGIYYAGEMRDCKKAVTMFSKASALDPSDNEARLELATSAVFIGALDVAIENYKKIVGQKVDQKRVLNGLAYCYDKLKKKSLAIKTEEKIIELYPDAFNAYRSLAVYAYRDKEYDKAILYMQKSLKINPSQETLKVLLHISIQRKNQMDSETDSGDTTLINK
jgi:tetratricopeptide (TPR) repeat protein